MKRSDKTFTMKENMIEKEDGPRILTEEVEPPKSLYAKPMMFAACVLATLAAAHLTYTIVTDNDEPAAVPVSQSERRTTEDVGNDGWMETADIWANGGEDRPVRISNSMPTGMGGRQMMDNQGNMRRDMYMTPITNANGEVEFVRGDDPRALAAQQVDDFKSSELQTQTEVVVTGRASDNHYNSSAKVGFD